MNGEIRNEASELLDYTFAKAANETPFSEWIVVLGHGVTGNKDREVIADLALALNAVGFDTLRFSYSGNGNSEGDFREATVSKEAGDLDAVISEVVEKYPKICYVGHSMGGAVGVLKTSTDPRINALVSLAGMIDTKAFAQTEFGEVNPDQGYMWDDEACPLSSAYMEDLCEVIGNLKSQAQSIRVPWLLLHGTADDVVLMRDTETVQGLKGESVSVTYIEGADHSFSDPSHKAVMVKTVSHWLEQVARSQS